MFELKPHGTMRSKDTLVLGTDGVPYQLQFDN